MMQTTLGVSRKTDAMYDSQSSTRVGLMKGDVLFAKGTNMTEIPQPAHDLAAIARELFFILTAGGDVRSKLQSNA